MNSHKGLVGLIGPLVLLLVAGCVPPGSGTSVQGLTEGSLDIESNNSVAEAVAVKYGSDGSVTPWTGRIATADDIDVYDLGSVQPGDAISVSVLPVNGSQTYLLVGLFDDNVDMVDYDPDDSDVSTGEIAFQHIVRHVSDHYYLGVAAYGDDSFPAEPGDYQVTITVTRGGTAPLPQNQVVLLDFDGGSVEIPGEGTLTMGAFDASRVSSQLAGQDAQVKQGIKTRMETIYDGYDIDFISTDDGALPGGEYSSVVFGTGYADAGFYGVSQTLDSYNQIHDDSAVIVTEIWRDVYASVSTTVDQLIMSLANVAAHELGHMLGLVHVYDVQDIMDNMGAEDALLNSQIITRSALDTDQMFPFGWQNAPVLLGESLGQR